MVGGGERIIQELKQKSRVRPKHDKERGTRIGKEHQSPQVKYAATRIHIKIRKDLKELYVSNTAINTFLLSIETCNIITNLHILRCHILSIRLSTRYGDLVDVDGRTEEFRISNREIRKENRVEDGYEMNVYVVSSRKEIAATPR